MCSKGNGLRGFCTEFRHLIKVQKLVLLKMKPTCTDELFNEIQIDLKNMLTTFATHKSTDYQLMMWQTSLHDAMRNINTFNPRNNVNCFITDLNNAYMLHVKLELATSCLDSRHSNGRSNTHCQQYRWNRWEVMAHPLIHNTHHHLFNLLLCICPHLSESLSLSRASPFLI